MVFPPSPLSRTCVIALLKHYIVYSVIFPIKEYFFAVNALCPFLIKKKLSYRSYNALISNQYELIGKNPEYVYLCGLWVHPPINSNTRSFIFRKQDQFWLPYLSHLYIQSDVFKWKVSVCNPQ